MEYIGNKDIRNQIKVAHQSANIRNDAMPHMLFAGAAGCGKTTLARLIAETSGYKFISVQAKSFDNHSATLDVLDRLDLTGYDERGNRTSISKIRPTLLFIDEIHELGIGAQELLGVAMEEFYVGSEIQGRIYWLPRFTLVGATTNDGLLSKPFLDRFGYRFPFKPYSQEEIRSIITVHIELLGEPQVSITPKAVREIAKRSRGIPRIVVKYLKNCRDMALSFDSDIITSFVTDATFEQLHIDAEGLTEVEVEILKALYEARTALGLQGLAIRVNENIKAIQNSCEPYLIQKGLIIIGGRGRKITEAGVKHLEKYGFAGNNTGREKIKKVDIPRNYVRT